MPPHADVLQWEHLPFPKYLRDFQRLFNLWGSYVQTG